MTTWTFEASRDRIGQLAPPAEDSARETFWAGERRVGVGVNRQGAYEVFITGGQIRAGTAAVRRRIEYDRWKSAGADPFLANRIVLPNAPHFQAIAALIVVEMLRLGLETGAREPQAVFDDVEPIIELALRRGTLSEEMIVGLLGELLCLEQLLRAVQDRPELRSSALDMWRGYQHAARDFLIGDNAIEVKTTTQASSSHMAHSLVQIEPQVRDHEREARLYLLSVGLAPTAAVGLTLPDRVDAICDILADPALPPGTESPLQTRFLDEVRQYGAQASAGYDHRTMKTWKPYEAAFTPTFSPRLYDLCDPDVKLLRRDDLRGTYVSPDRIEYRFDLPDAVSADNPVGAWQEAIRQAVRGTLGLSQPGG